MELNKSNTFIIYHHRKPFQRRGKILSSEFLLWRMTERTNITTASKLMDKVMRTTPLALVTRLFSTFE